MRYILFLFLTLPSTVLAESLTLDFDDQFSDIVISNTQQTGRSTPFIYWSALYNTYSVTINDIDFTAYTFCDLKNDFCSSNSRNILFLETTSTDFATPEGITVGTKAELIQGEAEVGGECKILPSFWYACFSVKFENQTTLFGDQVVRLIKAKPYPLEQAEIQ